MTRKEQFVYIELVKKKILEWSAAQGIKLFQVEFVVPFVETDFSLDVVFFYKKDRQIAEYKNDGSSEKLKQRFISILEPADYPQDHLHEITFDFDSDENVRKNYEGSYFYRMR